MSTSGTQVRRVLITGSRTWTNATRIAEALDAVFDPQVVLVSGACKKGADRLCEQHWASRGGRVERWPADWDRYGKAAGTRRNQDMVNAGADLCLAFIRIGSRGASDCAYRAQCAGIPTTIYREE